MRPFRRDFVEMCNLGEVKEPVAGCSRAGAWPGLRFESLTGSNMRQETSTRPCDIIS
jgi:hypothetical protein